MVLFLVMGSWAANSDVVINEVMANALDEDTGEFIELYNSGTTPVDVAGWGLFVLSDNNDFLRDYTKANDWGTNGTIIPAGGYALVVDPEYAGEYNAYLNTYVDPLNVVMLEIGADTGLGDGELTNLGDTIFLNDTLGYTASYTWTADAGEETTWEKINPTGGDGAGNWQLGIVGGTPGDSNANKNPVAVNDTRTTDEDIIVFSIDVMSNDYDIDGDNLSLQSVTNPSHGTASIVRGLVNYIPDADYFGTDSFDYTITDGNGGTATATVSMTITSINDNPVINSMSLDGVLIGGDMSVGEETEFTLSVTASDIDTNLSNLAIDLAASTIDGVAFSALGADWDIAVNDLSATITAETPGDYVVSVRVTDQEAVNDLSAAVPFNLTVLPGLDLSAVAVNGVVYTAGNDINVSPGDTVTVSFSYTNNYDETLGHINRVGQIVGVPQATIDLFDELPYEKLCNGVQCTDGTWAMLTGETRVEQITFQVPIDIDQDFNLQLDISYDDRFLFWGIMFADTETVNFQVVRQDDAVAITSIDLFDENLTCMRTALINLELFNTGTLSIVPEVLVYDGMPSGFDRVDGEFNNGNLLAEQTLAAIASASRAPPVQIPVDTNGLSKGTHTLYLYVVYPYFGSNYIGAQTTATINIDDCLNVTALEEFFTLPKNNPAGKAGNMLNYIIEDTASYNFVFSLTDESNVQLIDCGLVSPLLTCQAPNVGVDGFSSLTISVDEARAITPVVEGFDVTVTPTLEVSQVMVNGQAVVNGQTGTLLPDDVVSAAVTVRNQLDHMVTGITGELTFEGLTFNSVDNINLAAGQNGVLTIEGRIPLGICAGGCNAAGYAAGVRVEGDDFVNNNLAQSDVFNFNLMVQQAAADVVISALTLDDPDGLLCKDSTVLKVDLTNRGSNDESDVMVRMTGGELNLLEGPLVINSNGQVSQSFTIPRENLSTGNNVMTVEVSYRNEAVRTTDTVVLNKGSCIVSASPVVQSLTLADGEAEEFKVTLAEAGYDAQINWYVSNLQVVTGRDNYIFSQSNAGIYDVRAEINDESRSWTVTVTNVPISTTLQHNVPGSLTDAQLANFNGLVLSNANGRIEFKTAVDLRDVDNFDEVVRIDNGLIAVDSAQAPGLAGRSATITLYNTGVTNPLIKRNSGFVADKTLADEITTISGVVNGGAVTFDVTGFSTYVVLQDAAAELSVPQEVVFNEADIGMVVEQTFTVSNIGARDSLSNVVMGSTADAKYQVQFFDGAGAVLNAFNLGPGGVQTVVVRAIIPDNTLGGREDIGDITFTYGAVVKRVPLYIQTEGVLAIKSIDLNGKSKGDFKPGEENILEIELENTGDVDIEDIEVEVTIKDIDDGDDWDENEDIDKLKDGDKETLEFTFDVDAGADEDDYEVIVEVTVDGELVLREVKTFDMDREKHKLIIEDITFPNAVSCNREPTMYVHIENAGTSDEDEVTVKVSNSDLGLELEKAGLELEKFSKNDNNANIIFNMDLSSASAGNYELLVEVYRDGDLETSEKITLEVLDCKSTSSTTVDVKSLGNVDVLQDDSLLRGVDQPVVKQSIRDSCAYQALLAVLLGLALVAVILGLIVVMKKR